MYGKARERNALPATRLRGTWAPLLRSLGIVLAVLTTTGAVIYFSINWTHTTTVVVNGDYNNIIVPP